MFTEVGQRYVAVCTSPRDTLTPLLRPMPLGHPAHPVSVFPGSPYKKETLLLLKIIRQDEGRVFQLVVFGSYLIKKCTFSGRPGARQLLAARGPQRMLHFPFSTQGLFFISSGFRKGSSGMPSSIHFTNLREGSGGCYTARVFGAAVHKPLWICSAPNRGLHTVGLGQSFAVGAPCWGPPAC